MRGLACRVELFGGVLAHDRDSPSTGAPRAERGRTATVVKDADRSHAGAAPRKEQTVQEISHDVVIVGAGNAGTALAAQLLRLGARDVALLDPSRTHVYQPLLSYVGAGMATTAQTRRPRSALVPDGCTWHTQAVASVDPDAGHLTTTDGTRIAYGDLVLCPGARPDWDALPGSRAAMDEAHGSTNYLPELAPKTWELIRGLRSGTAVFTVPDRPVPCGGVAYKPLFLACDHWRRTGVLDRIEVVALVESPTMFGIPQIDRRLERAAQRYGVQVRTGTSVRAIRAEDQTLETTAGELHYDLLHLTPEHRAPEWIAAAGLSDGAGSFITVDERTLQHPRHRRVWGLGDAADTHSSKSGGALRKQVPVVAYNIAAARMEQPLHEYDGYSVAPITTSRSHLLLAEFDRDGGLQPMFGLRDLARPRPWTLAFDRYLQPQLYWHGILPGRL
nr:FAD/NAD(P)-binding oxidoreductase [Allobranchiibius huperziae]